MTGGLLMAGATISGGIAGLWVRSWLNTLTYRRSAETQWPTPGGRWWVPLLAVFVSAAVAWRIVAQAQRSIAEAGSTGVTLGVEQTIVLVVLVGAVWACIALAAIDLDVHRLPDRLTAPTFGWLVLGLGFAAVAGGGWSPWVRMAICAVSSGAFYLLLSVVSMTRGSTGLGLGDVKLAVVLGAALGWFGVSSVIVGVYAGFVIGGAWAVGLLLARRVGLRGHLPFGPAMMLGALCGLLVAPDRIGAMF